MTRETNSLPRRVYSGSEFDRRAGLNPYERRTLVRLGVLIPARTGGGWSVFTPADVERAKEWKARNR